VLLGSSFDIPPHYEKGYHINVQFCTFLYSTFSTFLFYHQQGQRVYLILGYDGKVVSIVNHKNAVKYQKSKKPQEFIASCGFLLLNLRFHNGVAKLDPKKTHILNACHDILKLQKKHQKVGMQNKCLIIM